MVNFTLVEIGLSVVVGVAVAPVLCWVCRWLSGVARPGQIQREND